MAQARSAAHTIKGAAGTLGLTRVATLARNLEQALGRAEEPAEALPLAAELEGELNRLGRQLEALGPPAEPAAVPSGDPTAVLARLKELLAADDTQAGVVFERHHAALREAYGEIVDRVATHIQGYDYPAALAALQALTGPEAGRDQ